MSREHKFIAGPPLWTAGVHDDVERSRSRSHCRPELRRRLLRMTVEAQQSVYIFLIFFFLNFRKISTTVSQHWCVCVCVLFFLFSFFVEQRGTGDQLASEMNMFSAAAGALCARVMNVIYTHRQYRYNMYDIYVYIYGYI